MSILIKDMEMPKEGRLTLQISADGAVYVVDSCSITAETYTTDAVPVPPHGALMDRDSFFATCPELVDGYKTITDDFVVIPEEEEPNVPDP